MAAVEYIIKENLQLEIVEWRRAIFKLRNHDADMFGFLTLFTFQAGECHYGSFDDAVESLLDVD